MLLTICLFLILLLFCFVLFSLVILFFSSQGTTSSSRSRRVHHPNPDPTVMEEWEREMGREESELIMDESRV